MDKKGYSTGFTWVFGLVTLFGLGILFITFDQVFVMYLVPTIKNMVNSSTGMIPIDEATKVSVYSGIDKYMTFWHILPYVLFFVVVLYMIIAAIRKEREGEFG
jgi:hypothetical protein